MICVEYVWLGGQNELRSKTKIIPDDGKDKCAIVDFPAWNYDGSSTGQADGHDSEVVIKPCALFNDPFRKGRNKMILCDTWLSDGTTPHPNNTRVRAVERFSNSDADEPWFGIEQEYFLISPETSKPLGFPTFGNPDPQGQYYCSVGARNCFGRDVVEDHMNACLYAGINLTGTNAEVAPGQHEFQVRDVGIKAADQLWMARYLLHRVAERHGVVVNYEPKPMKGDWNGSGCHTNFSTKHMREGDPGSCKTGYQFIEDALLKLANRHAEHIAEYGKDNNERLTGKHETSSMEKFSYARAHRGASVRIPTVTIHEQRGYFEDRRPAANMDPWVVTGMIYETTCLL